MYLVGFIIRIYQEARSSEYQKSDSHITWKPKHIYVNISPFTRQIQETQLLIQTDMIWRGRIITAKSLHNIEHLLIYS